MSKAKVVGFRNLGPVSRKWLMQIGLTDFAQVQELGAVEIYLRLKAAGIGVSMNLVYALQGAIMDLPWNKLPSGMKEALKTELAAAKREQILTLLQDQRAEELRNH